MENTLPGLHKAAITVEEEGWPVISDRWGKWRQETCHNQERSPTMAQREMINYIHAHTSSFTKNF
eukprot:10078221-Karenia_brevis.AAC.1